ncbi:hypothetical protein DBV15_06910, partial [Temnothorax longispinosus]
LPERGPEITGLSSHYAVGENVTANCSAWPSVPKANLRWTINGEPVKYLSASPALVNFPEASFAVYRSKLYTDEAVLVYLRVEKEPKVDGAVAPVTFALLHLLKEDEINTCMKALHEKTDAAMCTNVAE